MNAEPTVVLDGFTFLECPRWHDGRIWVADFYTHRVVSADADGSDVRVEAEVPNQPSGLGWLADGRLLVVSMRDRQLLVREADGQLTSHADLAPFVSGHPNDMVVDSTGRAYVGNFGFDLMAGADVCTATLVRVDPDGRASVAADGMLFPNGSVITPQGELIVAETFGGRLTAFDIGTDGSLSNRRTWAELGPAATATELGEALGQVVVAPDGICLDAEGAIWVADALGGRAVRVREGGEIVDEVRADGGVYACMLGGAQGTTLFLCNAPDFHEAARSAAREGRLLAVEVDVPHAGMP
ncbi:MAG: SMP-30/gluconolactonase/LRE family protein [Actinobacteria bacterium]|nr:SMP-30/gluconolactonase/LRE family protein [Actinomycetota bacterium]